LPEKPGDRLPSWQLRPEWVIEADDLPAKQHAVLAAFVNERCNYLTGPTLVSRRAFVNEVFWRYAYKARAIIVGFNLPFDLARLAIGWGPARRHDAAGRFSLALFDYMGRDGERRENPHRPRVRIKTIDSKRHLIQFTSPFKIDDIDLIPEGSRTRRPDDSYRFRGGISWTFAAWPSP